MDVNNSTDISGYYKGKRWFGLAPGRSHIVAKTFCEQKRIFEEAVKSRKLNNSGTPDPGDYNLLTNNCGTWAQLMLHRAGMRYPSIESAMGNGGAGLGGIGDVTGIGRTVSLTASGLWEMTNSLDQYYSRK